MLQRVLIVGFGSIGSRHARIARTLLPDAEIVVLRHRSCADVPMIGIDRCVTRVEQALEGEPQAAVIANPAPHHLELALRLARAGVHLLVEKPIAEAAQGVLELIELCRVRGLTLMTGYNLRFLPSLQRFRELLTEGRVGRVLSVRAEVGQYLPSWRPERDYRQSVSAKRALGGGVLLELSHEIDYLRWLFGEIAWVSATLGKHSDLEVDVEDLAYLTLGFASAAAEPPVVASLSMDFFRHDSTRRCTVIGQAGTLCWDALAGSLALFEQGSSAWQQLYEHCDQRDDSYRAQWRHFIECISEGREPCVTGEAGLAVLRVVEAARRSAASRAVAAVS